MCDIESGAPFHARSGYRRLPSHCGRKSPRGALRTTRPDDLAATVFRALLEKHPEVRPEDVEDIILGCAMPEAESGSNMARIAALRAGLPDTVPGVTIN